MRKIKAKVVVSVIIGALETKLEKIKNQTFQQIPGITLEISI